MFILLPFCGVIIREGLRAPRREALDDHKGAMNGLEAELSVKFPFLTRMITSRISYSVVVV